KRLAEEHGPGSEAAQRYLFLRLLARMCQWYQAHKRRQTRPAPLPVSLVKDPSVELRYRMTAAELLDDPPPDGEAVIAIPPEGMDSGRGRIFLRIGIGAASWIGSFERGHKDVCTISLMPDRKHLFVSAAGAGYIIDLKSRTLVEQTGTEIVGVLRDEPLSVFAVDHNG